MKREGDSRKEGKDKILASSASSEGENVSWAVSFNFLYE